jgi:hypothetical protein
LNNSESIAWNLSMKESDIMGVVIEAVAKKKAA